MTTPLPSDLAVGDKVTAAWLNLLAEWAASAGTWHTYTPTLTASVTNPTLGTASKQLGKYRQIGKTVHVQGVIEFGTSGTAGGSGSYQIGMPVTPAAGLGTVSDPATMIGNGWLSAGGAIWSASVVLFSDATVHMHYYPTLGTRTVVTAAAPGGWTAGDFLGFDLEYEAA